RCDIHSFPTRRSSDLLGLAGNGFDAQLVDLVRGSGREHYLVFQFGKEGVPERIILIEVQYTGNTDLAAGGLVRGQRLITEDPLVDRKSTRLNSSHVSI